MERFVYIILLLFGFVFQLFSQNINSNNLNRNQRIPAALLNEISIDLENASMQVALNEISKKGDIKLNYNSDIIPLDSKVSVKAEKVNTIEALMMVLKQTSTKLQITKNGSIIILPVDKEVEKGKIKGTIVDAKSGEPLIGANVVVVGTSIGAAADIHGKFVLPSLKPGNYTLKITYVGYNDKIEKVTVISNKTLDLIFKLDWVAVTGKEVIVTAQAKGQLSAINEQLSADEIKNVVSKDRIRELPDANAAESVGRLPGVSVLRSGGEGNKVVIRGLQPKYSKIMVDGVSLSATGSSDRSVDMSMISSYSLEGIEVIKAPTANMDGDQVGGSVNFKMRTAPEKLKYTVIAEGGYNKLKNEYNDYQFVGDISNRFFNNKFGVFAQATIGRKNLSSNDVSANYSVLSKYTDRKNPLGINDLKLNDIYRIRERYGATLTLDYKLSDGKIYMKNFFSSGTNSKQAYWEVFNKDRSHRYYTANQDSKQLIFSNILNYEGDFSLFKINAKLSHSYSEDKHPDNLMFNFVNTQDLSTFPLDTPPEEILNYAKNDIHNTYWESIRSTDDVAEGRLITASLDFSTDFSLSKQINGQIKFGAKYRYDKRSYNLEGYGGLLASWGGNEIKNPILEAFPWMQKIAPLGTQHMPYELFIDHNFKHDEFLNGEYTLGPVADISLMYDVLDVMHNTYDKLDEHHRSNYFTYLHKTSLINDYNGTEDLYAGYLMAEINITDKIKFIPGVRYEDKTTSYWGIRGTTNQDSELGYDHTDTTSTRQNNFFLPMIHLRYKPNNWMQIRLAYTQTLARPNFRYIIPNMDIGNNVIKINSPSLKPELAESFDVNFAFSNNYLGLFTIGGFWKNIKDKIYFMGKRIMHDPAKYGLSDIYEGMEYTAPDNISDISVVKGIEIDWQTNFWYLPSFLRGIVLNINYTKIFSETKYPKTEFKSKIITKPPWIVYEEVDKSYWDRMQNQPDDILNVALGYDYKGFSTRLSMYYQSDIFIKNSFWKEERVLTDDYLRWDLTVKQKLPIEGLELYGNIVNISSVYDKNFIDGNKQTSSIEHYGSIYHLGVRFSLQ
jgi:TonB-dependent receptor